MNRIAPRRSYDYLRRRAAVYGLTAALGILGFQFAYAATAETAHLWMALLIPGTFLLATLPAATAALYGLRALVKGLRCQKNRPLAIIWALLIAAGALFYFFATPLATATSVNTAFGALSAMAAVEVVFSVRNRATASS